MFQVVALTTTEKVSRGEMLLQQRELEDLHAKLQSANSSKAQDKQTINSLERRLAEERRVRNGLELQLNQERKSRKQEEARAAAAAAQAQSIRAGECTDLCRQRRRELESDVAAMRSTHKWYENEVQLKDRDGAVMADKLRETDLVISAMQEKTQHLENSLSAETRIKLDLFSALGEVKRQLEIKDSKHLLKFIDLHVPNTLFCRFHPRAREGNRGAQEQDRTSTGRHAGHVRWQPGAEPHDVARPSQRKRRH